MIWSPQSGPQTALISCPYAEIFFGGARGGGKSNGVLGKYGIKSQRYGKAFNAIVFRKELPQADDLIEEAKEIYLRMGGTFYDFKKTFVLPGGGRIRFRPLENVADAEKYQGQNVSDAAVEEAGNYADPEPIDRLFGCLRSKHGAPTQLILTGNPGGVGQSWLKHRYVDPAPLGMKRLTRVLPNGELHHYVYIPSRVSDNKILLAKDPNYINRLYLVGSKELVRAWLEGDFTAKVGAYFEEFGIKHIIEPFKIPQHWTKLFGFDWGFHSPFAAVYGAVSSGKDDDGKELPYPKGAIIIYRVVSQRGMDNPEIARAIIKAGTEWDISGADPSIFNHQGGESIGDQLAKAGLSLNAADNDRISGWAEIRLRLRCSPPMLYIFSHLTEAIDTISALPRSQKDPEDADTEANDHIPDALRYLCKLRTLENTYIEPVKIGTKGVIDVKTYIDNKRNAARQPKL